MNKRYSWNFGLLNTFEDQLKTVEEKNLAFSTKWKTREDYLSDPKVLSEAILEFDDLQKNYGTTGDLGYYWGLRESLDQSDPAIKAQNNKLEEFSVKLYNQNQFFLLKLSKVPGNIQKIFLESDLLIDFRHFLEHLFATGKFTLSDPEEKILNLKNNSAHSSWVRMTSQFLSEEKIASKTLEEYSSDLQLPDAKIRENAGLAINEILGRNAKIAEHELNAILYDKKINDDLRGVTRPDLMRHLADDIDSEVVDAMIEAVSSKFSLAHKFYETKAKFLGMAKLNYWDRNAPIENTQVNYDFETSVNLIANVFGNLDPEFQKIFMDFVDNGQIDVYPKLGKRGGAFCAIERPTQPTYILLNHTNNLRDVLTLAHEAGHGINNELMKSQKCALNFGSPLSTAEVASTFMEDFVLQSLPKDKTLIMKKLDDDISTIFRQVAAYKFEQELHETFRQKNYLSKEEIGEIFTKHMASYMGDFVKQNAGTQNWWVYWSHFRNFFYVYSYSSGLLISKAMQNKVKQEPKFIEKIKWFLSQGSSDSPKNLFLSLGIDITDKDFWLTGISEVEKLYEEVSLLV
ncbi:MAG: M3 family oligoendopeptidase [Candidatus Amesbacteria bacterium]|nr:M3 family oligoendopeptidase [Candidatus Amesbacteria bacterium]